MSTSSVQVETRGAVALVTLNRPDSSNTLNLEMAMDLLAAAMTVSARRGLHNATVVEITDLELRIDEGSGERDKAIHLARVLIQEVV